MQGLPKKHFARTTLLLFEDSHCFNMRGMGKEIYGLNPEEAISLHKDFQVPG